MMEKGGNYKLKNYLKKKCLGETHVWMKSTIFNVRILLNYPLIHVPIMSVICESSISIWAP